VQVSAEGGTQPRWNPAGKELFYRSGNKMMVVDVSTASDLALSRPRVLFEQRYVFSGQTVPNYDVSPDGQRFLMVKDDSAFGRINLVLNWFEELKRLVPSQWAERRESRKLTAADWRLTAESWERVNDSVSAVFGGTRRLRRDGRSRGTGRSELEERLSAMADGRKPMANRWWPTADGRRLMADGW
jgi:hypothetical protein